MVLKCSAANTPNEGRIARCDMCTKQDATQQTIAGHMQDGPSLGDGVVTKTTPLKNMTPYMSAGISSGQ